MAIPKRSSLNSSTQDLKHRVITCLNKLSDRDTQTIAITELEQIVKSLSDDSFSSFLTCIYDTDSSEKTPVRKQCVRLLGILSATHGEALSPYLSKMISNIIKRLRDSDSVVRSACIDSVTTMSTQIITKEDSLLLFLKPLMETMVLEQDVNSQMGSAMCLSSVIEACDDPQPAQLQRVLPKLVKLVKSDSFKAKPALLSLIRSVIGVGGVISRSVLVNLISCLVEFLSCEDWASRKAASEVFFKLAVLQKDMLAEFKLSCLSSFETRRFDKVKAVRESMNQMIEAWKNVPGVSEYDSSPLLSRSSSIDKTTGECSPSSSVSSSAMCDDLSQTKRKTMRRNSFPASNDSSATSAKKRIPLKSRNKTSPPTIFHKLDQKKSSERKCNPEGRNENAQEPKQNTKVEQPEVNESTPFSESQGRDNFFSKQNNQKMHKFEPRSISYSEECSDSTISDGSEDQYEIPKEGEDWSLLRKQLLQIENQQSSLLDLLQRFIGSSQNGIKSLETRVNGLEMALDEIIYDLRMSSSENTCCKLPGTDFLSPKFWRKSEGRYSSSLHDMVYKDGGFLVNPLAADICNDMRINSDKCSNRLPNPIFRDAERCQTLRR
ncbi:hypothetical protein ACHQM5_008472 [Ranunculus cassubicifolius]